MITKFRGRCPDGGWIYGSCVKFDENTCFIMPEFRGASTLSYAQIFNHIAQYVDIETITQSTGFRDKNGKEIFVGDIMEYTQKSINYSGVFHHNYVEVFQQQNGAYRIRGKHIYGTDAFCNRKYLKVVGNIFEDAELLEKDSFMTEK